METNNSEVVILFFDALFYTTTDSWLLSVLNRPLGATSDQQLLQFEILFQLGTMYVEVMLMLAEQISAGCIWQ